MPIAYINFYSDISNTLDRIYDDVFTITAQEENCKVYYICSSENDTKPLYISLDYGYTWTEVNPLPITGSDGTITQMGNTLCTLEKGKSIMLRATDETHSSTYGFEGYHLWTDKKSKVSGYLWSLVDGSEYITPETPEETYSFRSFFSQDSNYASIMDTSDVPNKITDISSLIFPNFCCNYRAMFKGCTELVDAKTTLPAETLNIRSCYSEMFKGCTKLKNSPEIEATSLEEWRTMSRMFEDCSSLKDPCSALKAETGLYCDYEYMFKGCTNLTSCPIISLTTLGQSNCVAMFMDCTSLTTTPLLLAEQAEDLCYEGMFKGCTLLRNINTINTFISTSNNSYASMFEGCTSLTDAPELPALAMSPGCYQSMFEGCTSLTTAPTLPAQHLADICYKRMFNGCTSLNYIHIKSIDDYVSTNFTRWVENVAPRGTFVKDRNVTYPINHISGVPIGWTIIDEGDLQKHVTVTIEPDGSGTVTGAGRYYQYDIATLTATPATGCYFGYWKKGTEYYSDSAEIAVIVDSDIEMTAVFVQSPPPPKYNLSVTSEYSDHCTLSGSGRYEENEFVAAYISNIDLGWKFLGWYNGDTRVSLNNEYDFYMPAYDVSLEARLMKYINEFSYNINIEDAGEITCTYDGMSLEIGDTYYLGWDSIIHLEATALAGYKFVGFYDGNTLLSNENIYEFNIRDDVEIIVAYRPASGDKEYWENEYLAIESSVDGNEVYISAGLGDIPNTSGRTYTIYYSYNKTSWSYITIRSSEIINSSNRVRIGTLNRNDIMYLKGVNSYLCSTYSTGSVGEYIKIYATNSFSLKGNILSIVYGDGFRLYNTLPENISFAGIFASSAVTDADLLVLPAITLNPHCYEGMFWDCTSLTTTPELPATTLNGYCYSSMFEGCTSLTTAPALPATTLATGCYLSMFANCTSLTTTPELPATTLNGYCYSSMFEGCTSLTTAPALPATTLAEWCYDLMFSGCTSLTSAPALPATTLANYCYSWMFAYCTSLTTAPQLPATTLANYCYNQMFRDCTSLTTAPALPATTLVNYCYITMFKNCTSLVYAPALPATTLAQSCYVGMFEGCTSLTTAPELPATTLVHYCYNQMFMDCTSLTTISALFTTDISVADYYTEGWVTNVSSTGTFNKNVNATWDRTGDNGIPHNWTIQEVSGFQS